MASSAEEIASTALSSPPRPPLPVDSLLDRNTDDLHPGQLADCRNSAREDEEESPVSDEDQRRELKRRRISPAALENVADELEDAAREFSFSFDTAGIAPIGTTPKFGSFNAISETKTSDVVTAAVEKEPSPGNGSAEVRAVDPDSGPDEG